MAYAERHTVAITTAAGGTATAYTPVVTGRVLNIRYIKDDFADGVDFAITAETSGLNLWTENNVNASKTVSPVQAAHLATGAASTLTEAPIFVAFERIKIVIAEGGATKSGTFLVVVA